MERFSFNWIHWIRIRTWWYSTKDRVTSWKRSSWICRLWSSAFGCELNFHDDALAAANESQNISETSNSDQNLSSASTKKTKLRKKMKGFLKNRPNKKFKGSYEKNKKLEHQRSKSFRKNWLKEWNMKIKRLTKLCMAYYESWHTWHKQCYKHSTFLWLFSPMIPPSNFDYSGQSTNSNGNNSSSKTTWSLEQLKKMCSFSSSS